MEKLTQETERIMTERFGKDTVIALATTENGIPHVRYVNAFYEDGAFYIITYALSGKMNQLEKIRPRQSPETGLRRMERESIWDISEKRRTGTLQKS